MKRIRAILDQSEGELRLRCSRVLGQGRLSPKEVESYLSGLPELSEEKADSSLPEGSLYQLKGRVLSTTFVDDEFGHRIDMEVHDLVRALCQHYDEYGACTEKCEVLQEESWDVYM